jgi:N-acetylglutamate synthase-like GNAT family acetyltransferase
VVGRVYGVDELGTYLEDIAEAWEKMRQEAIDVQRVHEDRVVATVRFEARARSTGATVDQLLGVVVDFRGEQIVHMRAYASPDEALAAVARDSSSADAPQRRATLHDAEAISELMRVSVLELFPRYYDERQTASAAVHIADLDVELITDGTYFVHEAGGEIVACGGWSRRNKLFAGGPAGDDDGRLLDPATEAGRVRAMFVRSDWTRRGLGRAIFDSCVRDARAEGFRRLALMATLPGEPLYLALGFREVERVTITAPDGVQMAGVAMERVI